MARVWIESNKSRHREPRHYDGDVLVPPRDEGPATEIIGPFENEEAAREFVKTDPRIWIYGPRKLRRDPTPDELNRAITPDDWNAQGRRILGAVWITPKTRKYDSVGPFESEMAARQFAKDDPLLSGSVDFVLRRDITPDELMDADTPEAWSEYREEDTLPEGARRPRTSRKVYGTKELLQMAFAAGVFLFVTFLPGMGDFVRPGFSSNFWQADCQTRICYKGAYVLYFVFVAIPLCLLIVNLPGWLWKLWRVVRGTK